MEHSARDSASAQLSFLRHSMRLFDCSACVCKLNVLCLPQEPTRDYVNVFCNNKTYGPFRFAPLNHSHTHTHNTRANSGKTNPGMVNCGPGLITVRFITDPSVTMTGLYLSAFLFSLWFSFRFLSDSFCFTSGFTIEVMPTPPIYPLVSAQPFGMSPTQPGSNMLVDSFVSRFSYCIALPEL